MEAVKAQTRIQLRNILFCTDLSDASSNALAYATALARHFGSTLYALYVRNTAANARVAPREASVLADLPESQAREQIKHSLGQFSGFERDILILEGDLWSSIKTAIDDKQIDLLVLGTRGRTGISKLVLGSAAEELFRRAPCAVLSVGPNSPTQPSRPGELSEILYATDFTPEAEAAAAYAISLAQEYQAHLTLLHVIGEPKTGDLVTSEQLAAATERRLWQIVPPESELWCEPHCIVGQGAAADEILTIANHRKADLIILGVRRPAGFRGGKATHLPIATAHKVVSAATCPVLTIRG
jgi:nucleotide-binding universal stress UspA family protein